MATEFRSGFEIPDSTTIWRCMPRRYFSELISSEHLHFASARMFNDPWEGSLSRPCIEGRDRRLANYTGFANKAFEELCRLTKISCWHIAANETPAMWARYTRDADAIAIKSSVGRLRAALGEYRIEPHYGNEPIEVGAVKYIDFETEPMEESGWTSRFFFKDRSFAYESEFRAVVSLHGAESFGVRVPEHGVQVPTDTKQLIVGVLCSPLATNSVHALSDEVGAAGLKCTVESSSLHWRFA